VYICHLFARRGAVDDGQYLQMKSEKQKYQQFVQDILDDLVPGPTFGFL